VSLRLPGSSTSSRRIPTNAPADLWALKSPIIWRVGNALPKGIQVRARKVVTRSGKRFRGKFPSKKNAIMVQWESLLERDAILMFEYHCEVRTYQEQPSVEAYYDDAHRPHRYYPDFGVIVKEGQQILYEVKHEVDLAKPHIKRKLEAVAKRLAEQGRLFRILTEKEIRRTPLFTNLQRLHASGKQRVSSSDLSHLVDRLSGGPVWTFVDITGQLGSEAHALALIGSGRLRTDLEQLITDDSKVWLPGSIGGGHDSFRL
jgi:hypothetical protein